MSVRWLRIVVVALFVCSTAGTTSAAVINFDDQGLVGPSLFALAGPAQVHVINAGGKTATFAGGVILTQTANLPANQTSVYGTADFGDATLVNPLTITFDSPITNFFLDVYNGMTFDVRYRVSDNVGNSAFFTLVPNTASGETTIGFPAAGTIITIEALTGLPDFDFFIDNITFDQDLPPNLVPEPASLLLLGTGLFGLSATRRIRRHRR